VKRKGAAALNSHVSISICITLKLIRFHKFCEIKHRSRNRSEYGKDARFTFITPGCAYFAVIFFMAGPWEV
jgi:hypothetical protein